MSEGNNGGYANSWLVGDRKTGEIARLELGLKNKPLERTKDGYCSWLRTANMNGKSRSCGTCRRASGPCSALKLLKKLRLPRPRFRGIEAAVPCNRRRDVVL